jgi:spectrin beta
MRDKEEMVDLINTQLTVAASEDYGKDLHDVERLIHNFDLFMDNLTQHEEKLAKFNSLSNELMNDVLDYEIEEKTKEVNGMWEDLSELASARREALSGAKKVHAFDKKIDDTLEWILEKEALLSVEINCQDSETIQDLKQRQVGLKQDVKAINDQVRYLSTFFSSYLFELEAGFLTLFNLFQSKFVLLHIFFNELNMKVKFEDF